MGRSLAQRHNTEEHCKALNEEMNDVLRRLGNHIRKVYGSKPSARMAAEEIEEMAEIEGTPNGIMCKRGAMLYALTKEPEMVEHFAALEEEGAKGLNVRDLTERVLPWLAPRFVKHSCQAPDAFVMACLVMSEMWRGEKLGNWPLVLPGEEEEYEEEEECAEE